MTGIADRPFWRLTRHFFAALFRLGFLSDAAADSFTRVVIGVAAVVFSLGLLMTRIYAAKYAVLGRLGEGAYLRAAIADEAFIIALPMWLVAFVTVLASGSLFPTHVDFRVLTPLPVSRAVIFGARLAAIAMFTGLFLSYGGIALLPLVVLMSAGRGADATLLQHLTGYASAELTAAALAVSAIAAVNGAVTVWAPARLVERLLTSVRSVLVGVLIVLLPLAMRLPAQANRLAAESAALYVVPPVWFVGIWSAVVGRDSAYLASMRSAALIATIGAAAVSGAIYALVYRRFDRLMLRPVTLHSRGADAARRTVARAPRGEPAGAAVRTFTRLTLSRSALHQSVAIGVAACGVGIVVSSLLPSSQSRPAAPALPTVAWAPFALLCAWSVALWGTLMLPVEHSANWIFRMTERSQVRSAQLVVAPAALRALASIGPTLLFLLPQWHTFGAARAAASAFVQLVYGELLIELLIADWRRIPFTCSYMPGKRFLGHTVLIAFAGWMVFTVSGPVIALTLSRGSRLAAGLCFVVIAIVATLKTMRRRMWRELPLMFEDELPVDVVPIRLSG